MIKTIIGLKKVYSTKDKKYNYFSNHACTIEKKLYNNDLLISKFVYKHLVNKKWYIYSIMIELSKLDRVLSVKQFNYND